jgi:hypothetical protein
MGVKGRFFSSRDLRLIASLNGELMGDIIENIIQMYKIAPDQTETNMYGETSAKTGKFYFPAIQISALVERESMNAEYDDFGVSRSQNYIFKMREKMLKQLDFYPEIGDIVSFNDRFYEISNVTQENLLGGQPDKSFDIICFGHYTKYTSLNILERNQ